MTMRVDDYKTLYVRLDISHDDLTAVLCELETMGLLKDSPDGVHPSWLPEFAKQPPLMLGKAEYYPGPEVRNMFTEEELELIAKAADQNIREHYKKPRA